MQEHDSHLKVREYEAWSRLHGLLTIEPGQALHASPKLSTTIVPTLNFLQLLESPTLEAGTVDLSAASGTYVAALTVPSNERWTIDRIEHDTTTASTRIVISDGTNEAFMASMSTAQTYGGVATLDRNWTVGLLTTGNAGDNARVLRSFVRRLVCYR